MEPMRLFPTRVAALTLWLRRWWWPRGHDTGGRPRPSDLRQISAASNIAHNQSGKTLSIPCVVQDFSENMQQTIDKEASLFFVSGPEVVLSDATALVESHGGLCAAFTQDDPQSPKPMPILEFQMRLCFMARFAKMWGLLEDFIASWTLKQRWRCLWKGRVSQGLNMLKKVYPQKDGACTCDQRWPAT